MKNSPSLILVMGIPGCGKSSILEILAQKSDSIVINYGDAMMSVCSKMGISRDEMRKLPSHEQLDIGVQAACHIALQSKIEGKTTIVDTHALIKSDVAFIPGVSPQVIQELKPAALVLITASPKIVSSRRQKDLSRYRDVDHLTLIEEHQNLCKSYVVALSAQIGCPFSIIDNDQSLSDSSDLMCRFVSDFRAQIRK